MRPFLVSLSAVALAALAAAQSPLTTLFATNNNGSVGGGIYFDLNVTHPPGITISQIDINTTGTGAIAASLDVFTIPGTRAGNQTNLAAWTGPSSLGNTFLSAPVNTPTVVLLSTPITLPMGSWGIAFRANGFANAYTNGTGTNQTFTNAEATLTCGEATNVAFSGSLFTPRVVNCSLHYTPGGGGTVLSLATPYGTGCVQRFTSFYENFPTPVMDLANSAMSMFQTGTGYLVLPGVMSFVPPSAAATVLPLGNEAEVTVALGTAMPVVGGTTASLTVCSNGYVSVASGNGVLTTPLAASLLSMPRTVFACWHDYDPSIVGGGRAKFELAGGIAYVTFDGVFDAFAVTGGSTFQLQFELASGHVHFVWGNMSGQGNGHLIGYSLGGPSADPGNRDLSATLAASFLVGTTDITPLGFAVSPRPIVNTTIQLTTSNLRPTTAFGAIAFGLNPATPPIDLGAIGMAGCFQYHDILATFLYLPLGAASVNTPLTVPNMVGLHLQAQSYCYDPTSNFTQLGAIASRAFDLRCGDY